MFKLFIFSTLNKKKKNVLYVLVVSTQTCYQNQNLLSENSKWAKFSQKFDVNREFKYTSVSTVARFHLSIESDITNNIHKIHYQNR